MSDTGPFIAGDLLPDALQARRSLWGDALRRFRRNRLGMLGLIIVCFLVFLAVFADLLAWYDYKKVFFAIRHPVLPFVDPEHPLGTDTAGRDYLSRLIYGARTSLFIGLLSPVSPSPSACRSAR